jgi:hypothetical protein
MQLNPNGAGDCNASHQAADKHYTGSNLLGRLLTASGEEVTPV